MRMDKDSIKKSLEELGKPIVSVPADPIKTKTIKRPKNVARLIITMELRFLDNALLEAPAHRRDGLSIIRDRVLPQFTPDVLTEQIRNAMRNMGFPEGYVELIEAKAEAGS